MKFNINVYVAILTLFLVINATFAQVPQGIPYQAAARGANGQPLVNSNVKVRFSIIDSVATGTTVYQETHAATTNTVGLFSVNVGLGTPVTGTFAGINWGKNFKFMKVELDPTGTGSNYTDLGTQQMMSVPYALYAGNVSNSNFQSSASFTHYIGEYYGGGIVFHLYRDSNSVEHGLIVAPMEASSGAIFYNTVQSVVQSFNLSNSTGYNDWYLPSIDELRVLLCSYTIVNWRLTSINNSQAIIGGFGSSTITGSDFLGQYFDMHQGFQRAVNGAVNIRLVRQF